MFSTYPFVLPSIHYQRCEHDIIKTNKPILIQTGTSDIVDILGVSLPAENTAIKASFEDRT